MVKLSLIFALAFTFPTSIVGQCPLTGDAIPAGYSLRNGRYYKYSSTSLPHASAVSVCSGEGGATLAVVQTANDKAAMDYFRSTTGSDFWIGLTKKSGRVGITCDQGGCNDALEWEDGTNFLRNPDAQPVVAATETDSDSNCFVVETDRFTDRPCSAQYNPFLCQFTCTVPDVLPLPSGDEPTYTYWRMNVQVNNQINTDAEYPRLCLDECKKNCSAVGENKCFGKMYITSIEAVSNTTVQVPCECGQSSAMRYPGRYCGPHRQACHRQDNGEVDPGDTFEGIWVDGYNTFKNVSVFSDMSAR